MPAPCHASPAPSSDQLSADITHQEVEAALKRLKRNKAAGVDGIKAEFILDVADLLVKPLVLTFNQRVTPSPGVLVSFIRSTKLETETILEITEASQLLLFCPKFMQ